MQYLDSLIDAIGDGCSCMTMINFETSYKLPIGEKMIDFQDILNSNLPTLLPAIFTAFIFLAKLCKKGMNSTKSDRHHYRSGLFIHR